MSDAFFSSTLAAGADDELDPLVLEEDWPSDAWPFDVPLAVASKDSQIERTCCRKQKYLTSRIENNF